MGAAKGVCFKTSAVNASVVENLRLMRFERLIQAEVAAVDGVVLAECWARPWFRGCRCDGGFAVGL